MNVVVIDTNVLLVADGKAPHMSVDCQKKCLTRLECTKAKERIVLDDARLILREYHNKLSPNSSQTYGSAFLKWLLQVEGNAEHVSKVTITPRDSAKTLFLEFPPDLELEAAFDPADRKFVAAACAHPEKPPILEAADSKWLGWETQLKNNGIEVEFVCRAELNAIREKKSKK